MTWLDAACLFALLVIFGLSAIGFFWYMRQMSLDREIERHIKLTRFRYDQRGNPEYFYDPATGDHFLPAPGNNPSAPPESVIFHPVRVERYAPATRSPELSRYGRPVEVQDTSNKIEVKEVLEALPEPDQKLLLDLLQAKEGGASDSAAIRQVTGAKGGTTFQRAKQLLDQFSKGVNNV